MKYQVQENCLTIFLPGELDHHNAEEIRKESDHLIEHNHIPVSYTHLTLPTT